MGWENGEGRKYNQKVMNEEKYREIQRKNNNIGSK